MRIRKLRKYNYITMTSGPYKGESFEVIKIDDQLSMIKNPFEVGGHLKVIPGNYDKINEGWDIELYDNSYATSNKEVTEHRLIQRLSIHLGELQYDYEDTRDIGIPYLYKKSKDELDMILKEEISLTEGVKRILTFDSEVKERSYICTYSVEVQEGEILWQTVTI